MSTQRMPGIARAAEVKGGSNDGARLGVVDTRDAALVVLVETSGAVHLNGKISGDKAAVIETLRLLLAAVEAS